MAVNNFCKSSQVQNLIKGIPPFATIRESTAGRDSSISLLKNEVILVVNWLELEYNCWSVRNLLILSFQCMYFVLGLTIVLCKPLVLPLAVLISQALFFSCFLFSTYIEYLVLSRHSDIYYLTPVLFPSMIYHYFPMQLWYFCEILISFTHYSGWPNY